MNRLTCLEVEPLLAEYVEGAPAAASPGLEEHLSSCAACRATLEDMRLALSWTRSAEELPVPWQLVTRILDLTGSPAKAEPVGWSGRLRGWFQPVFEPRFAMGTAMALISFSFLLNAAGVDLRNVSLADLNPARVYFNIDRKAHLAGARAVKFYRDLRIVYEIQSQLQTLREESAAADEKQAAPPEKKKDTAPRPETQQKQQNRKWSKQMSVLAAAIR